MLRKMFTLRETVTRLYAWATAAGDNSHAVGRVDGNHDMSLQDAALQEEVLLLHHKRALLMLHTANRGKRQAFL